MLLFCRQQLHKNRFFVSVVFILGLLFISVALFIEHRNTQHLEAQLLLEAESFRNGFELSQKDLQQQMLLVATLLAENTRVQTLFYQGQQAFIREAGDSNGAETTYWRSALLQYMASRWQLMQSEFGMRQLQFHLVPEVTSFLRVHQPDLFGDSLRGIRPIVEDVLLDQHPRSGFETGRIYSGVRGVVPVYANLPFQAPQLIGSLEVGTSFDAQLMRLDEQYNAGFAVLLRQEHVDDQVWQRFQNLKGLALPEGCECYIEAYTRDTIIDLLGLHRSSNLTANQIESVLVELSDQLFHLIRFPLFDYATDEKQTSPVGSVWIWQEKTELASLLQQSRVHTRLMLLVTFLMAVASVAWVLRLTRRKLIEKIDAAVALQKTTAEELAASERRYQNAFSAINDGLWEVNLVTGELHWDQRCFEMLGYHEMKPLHVNDWYAHIHPDDLEQVSNKVAEHFETGAPYQVEYRSRCAQGGWLWIEGRGRVTQWDGDIPVVMTGSATDISARKKAEQELRHLSVTDSLTGLYNRRYFFKRLSSAYALFKRKQRHYSVIMLDLDHFKAINDQYGHAAGDKVLKQLSINIKECLREPDIFARLGGEEFAVLLDDTDKQGAVELAQRIQEKLSETSIDYKLHSIKVTASMGISEFRDTDHQADDVMLRADRCLYQAKLSGRNAIIC